MTLATLKIYEPLLETSETGIDYAKRITDLSTGHQ
jgi:hypothetical protein